jgi:DNA mismatch endonuclease (patch repair protein)
MEIVTAARSYNMSRVRGDVDTLLERRLASKLRTLRVRGSRRRCQVHAGRPDFCFHAAKVAVFVDGCFWHWCPIHFKLPKTRTAFWRKKLSDNRTRDRRQTQQLRAEGWTVIRVWNHDLRTIASAERAAERIARALQGRVATPLRRASAVPSRGEKLDVLARRCRLA